MEELQRYWLILQRRKIPVLLVFVPAFGLAILWANSQKPIYEARAHLLLKNAGTNSIVGNSISQAVASNRDDLNTSAVMLRSLPIAEATVAKLKLSNVQPESFIAPLRVKPLPQTSILELSYRSTNPIEAAKAVNAVMTVYSEKDVESSRTEVRSGREFIEQQLPIVEASVQRAELALRRFKDENLIIDVESETTSAAQLVNKVEDQLYNAQLQLTSANTKSAALKDLIGLDSQTAFAVSNPSVQEVLAELQKVEQRLALEGTRFQDKAPVILDLKDKQATLTNLVRQRLGQSILNQEPDITGNFQVSAAQQQVISSFVETEVERATLGNRLAALSTLQAYAKERASNVPKLVQQQGELERQLKAAQSTYETLLGRLQEARVAENQKSGNVRIVSQANVPGVPVAPNRQADLLKGALLAAVLAAGVAMLLEALDKSIKTTEEAKALAGYPLLGIIPNFRQMERGSIFNLGAINLGQVNASQLQAGQAVNEHRRGSGPSPISEVIVKDTPNSRVSEAFRMLQTNLKFLNVDKALKVVVITSSMPKEGKSTISANLAVAMAQVGRKVLLIDGDMRNPSQHRIWEVPNAIGLSNVVSGQSELSRGLHELMPNLQLLTSGISPPNPVAILDSQRMVSLVESLSQSSEFDFVIIDSPPVTVAADATLLGKLADGIILLVRPGVSDSNNFTFSKQLLDQTGQNVLGIVVNGVIPDADPYNYYYYSSEGYGQEETLANTATVEAVVGSHQIETNHQQNNGHHPTNGNGSRKRRYLENDSDSSANDQGRE